MKKKEPSKMGRPKSVNPINYNIKIGLTEELHTKVMEYNKLSEQTIAQTVREALNFFFKHNK